MRLPEIQAGSIGASGDFRLAHAESMSYAVEQCRVWLTWSAAHIEECLRGDAAASDRLLASLADVLAPASAEDATGSKMAAVVVAVQFHDRLMQGLSHVVQSLHALHEQIGDPGRAGSPESWRALRDKQFRAFSMAEERALFVAMVAHQDDRRPEADSSAESSVELFGDDGDVEP